MSEEVRTETAPDVEARHDPRHAVLAAALRDFQPEHPVMRVWGRWTTDSSVHIEGNSWAGTPEDVADILVRALQAVEVAPPPAPKGLVAKIEGLIAAGDRYAAPSSDGIHHEGLVGTSALRAALDADA